METKARYVLIGAFTLSGLVGLLTFFLWFARLELDRQYEYFDVVFDSVAGLGNASDVRFSGLPVGQVVDVRLSPDAAGTVLVRLEVTAGLPVRTDSVATVDSQGVTGVAFVGISSGSPEAPLLTEASGDAIPRIRAGRSVLQSLSEDAPALLEQVLRVAEEIGQLLGDENRGRLDRILVNVETSTEEFAGVLSDFSRVAESVGTFADEIGRFNTTLDGVTTDLGLVLENADVAVGSISALAEEGRAFVATGTDALLAAQDTLAEADRFVAGTLTEAVADLRAAIGVFQAEVLDVGDRTGVTLSSVDQAAVAARDRLAEIRATVEAADSLIAALGSAAGQVGDTAQTVDALLAGEGAALIAETRAAVAEATSALAAIGTTAREDLPGIMADVRGATESVARVVEEVGGGLTQATGWIAGLEDEVAAALTGATDTFARANDTLAALDTTLATGDRALGAAERAFAGADRAIAEDLAGIVQGLEDTLADLRGAVGTVSAEIPGITSDLRSTSAAAERAFAELERTVSSAGGAVEQFAGTGLPLYTKLATEIRTLIDNMNRITVQIQRDPGRFLLDSQSPEFRR